MKMALPRRLPLTRLQLVFKKITDLIPGIAVVSYLEWLSNEYTTIGLDNMAPPLKTAMDLVGIKMASEAFSALHTAATQEKPWESFKQFLAEAGNGSSSIGALKEITKYAIKVSVPLAVTAVAYGFTMQAISKQIHLLMERLMEHPEAVTNLASYMLASVILNNPQSYYAIISALQSIGEASMDAFIQHFFPSPAQLIQTHPFLTNTQKVGQTFLALADVLVMQQTSTLFVTNIGPEFVKEWRFFPALPIPLAALLRGVRYLSRAPEPIEQIVEESTTPIYTVRADEEQPFLVHEQAAPTACTKLGIVSKEVGKNIVLESIATVVAGLSSLPLTSKIPPGAAELPYSGLLFVLSQLPKEGIRYLGNLVANTSCRFFSKKEAIPARMIVNDDDLMVDDIENDAVNSTKRRCFGLC